jgi:hypothetical protein
VNITGFDEMPCSAASEEHSMTEDESGTNGFFVIPPIQAFNLEQK